MITEKQIVSSSAYQLRELEIRLMVVAMVGSVFFVIGAMLANDMGHIVIHHPYRDSLKACFLFVISFLGMLDLLDERRKHLLRQFEHLSETEKILNRDVYFKIQEIERG